MGKKAYILLGIIIMLIAWWWLVGNNMDRMFFDSDQHWQNSIQMLYIIFFVLHGFGILFFFKAYRISKNDSKLKLTREYDFKDRLVSQRRGQDNKIDELEKEIKKLKKNEDGDDKNDNPFVNPKK